MDLYIGLLPERNEMDIRKSIKDPQGVGDFVTIVLLIMLAGFIMSLL